MQSIIFYHLPSLSLIHLHPVGHPGMSPTGRHFACAYKKGTCKSSRVSTRSRSSCVRPTNTSPSSCWKWVTSAEKMQSSRQCSMGRSSKRFEDHIPNISLRTVIIYIVRSRPSSYTAHIWHLSASLHTETRSEPGAMSCL